MTVSAPGTAFDSFTYDGAGRRSTRTSGGATTTYAYDVLGRLTAVASPSYALGLFYDAHGAKTRRTETGQLEARFLGPWAERRANAKYRQVAAPGAMGPLGETQAATDWTYLRDGAGNAIRTSQNGNPLHTRRYEAFGKLRSGAIGSLPRGFAGLPTEGSSGLYHASARHYDPATGRFLQPDPAGLYAPNLYAYAANNPVVYGDPTGLAPWLSLSGPPDWLGFDAGDSSRFPLAGLGTISAAFSSEGRGGDNVFAGIAALFRHNAYSFETQRASAWEQGDYASAALYGVQGFGSQLNAAWAQDYADDPAEAFKHDAIGLLIGTSIARTASLGHAFGAAGEIGSASLGAARRLAFESSPKHGRFSVGNVAAGPKNGQAALDLSLQVSPYSPRRIGIDYDAGEFVVFDQTRRGVFHGHVREFDQLTSPMQNLLLRSGQVTRRGRIIRE